MHEPEKAVLRFIDGTVLKGYLESFAPEKPEVTLRETDTDVNHAVLMDELKAIFFVRTFAGNRGYQEKKSYGIRKPRGRRTFIKFTDGEDLVGFLDGEVPWERGFFLSKQTTKKLRGFFLLPADEGSNNIRIFVVARAVRDVTVVP